MSSFESFPQPSQELKKSPENLMKAIKFFMDRTISSLEVKGKEHLKEIPKDKKVIIAPSHSTDFDLPLAYYALGDDFKLRFTHESTLNKFSVDPLMAGAMRVYGKDNFLPIDYKKDTEGIHKKGSFNPDDYVAMKQAAEEGDTLLIAAHNNSHDGKMARNAGYADVYFAQLVDGVIIPTAVDIESKDPAVTLSNKVKSLFKKTKAKVTIGEPISFPKIPGVENFADLVRKSKESRLDAEEQEEFHRIRIALREQSEEVMCRLAEMLPEEKRGVWNKKIQPIQESKAD
jgi:1-acyl-sn-glycerol-3-phosphate acyltransferase